ncbi:amino acid carrier family protein [Synechococcus sp. Minos11]|uniref:alanine/glycine:cation symporter family protein n=1 Tax=Synechococcus sp. Minos11 TaxID=221341 RepID=UPI000E07E6E8|nr:sodium:alanine symporter family protein [Synechococcus sp. Minos11]QNJ08515.1 amino acid carrier family protein [Synechococcus sp. Minos11]RCL62071.1 MAG: alanine:cation symporter family protein [Synechococcus sp. MED-G67]HCV56026.1 sodium:alanine symporter family protein [Synechococcales bacterium UBA12195]|tara:strand:+ start:167 stop:1501 length:1335 start_codon:yes stop_codon:yes gene_type:complete
MEQFISSINDPINGIVWGWPMVLLIAFTGIVLMLGLRFMPLQRLPYGVRMLWQREAGESDGDITPFQALMTSLSATIGTGNIAGVAGAIAIGGPGAVFWMWVIAVFGIATKYAEAVLAVRYREVDGLGNHVGGPMYYIRNGLGPNWQWLAVLFALFGMLAGFGIGNGVQCFEVSSALAMLGVPRLVTGIVLGAVVFAVIIGGIKRIAQAASAIVPLMSVLYLLACLIVLLINIESVPEAFATIFGNAFSGEAAAGGAFGQVVLMGFKRGIFSNEAGLGSAPIAHAAAKTNDPVRQGTVAMLGTFIDTLIICTMTALVIITTGVYANGEAGAVLSITAFNTGLMGSGGVVTAGLVVFAFTTVLGWSFYGERCTEFLFGEKAILPFRLVWVAVVVIGSVAGDRGVVWGVADTLNGLMALPNLIALLLLSGTVFRLTRDYRFNQAGE